MLRNCIGAVLLLSAISMAQNPLHVFYSNGEAIEQMNIKGVTVSITLKDMGRLNQVAVFVNNRSPDAVNVVESDFALHQSSPRDEDLKLKSEQEVRKLGSRNAFGQVANKMGTGLTAAKDKMTGKEPAPVSTAPPDFETEAHWLARANQLGEREQIATLAHMYLRGSTVFPGSSLSGVLWFDRDQALGDSVVRVKFGERGYEFPFPPPAYATTPANPDQPNKTPPETANSAVHDGHPDSRSAKAGVLGIAGETWSESGVGGVRILEVTENSAADLAGLRPANVITEVDAAKIRSTDDLAAALARRGPGSRIRLTYLFWTNLGWMAKETTVILAGGIN